MDKNLDRRGFLKRTLAASTGAAAALSFEEQALVAYAEQPAAPETAARGAKGMPTGKIGDVEISRLVCGGNLISGFAHSRDLIYVSSLLKQYFTDDKVFETFRLCEANGINTAILRYDPLTLRIISRYWREIGGNLQWIAQIKPKNADPKEDIRSAVEAGAIGCYIQGESGDAFVRNGHIGDLAKAIENIKGLGVIAGMGAHSLETVVACEKAGIPSDFYMKTFNSKSYWSAGTPDRHDNVWEETPEPTKEFMKTVGKPWIAFKVLGAGAIHPSEGFKYAFEHGADFICAGMFDFQVVEDAEIARKALAETTNRARPWRA